MGGADNSETGTIGFIGFGEAGSLIAKGLGEAGAPRIFAYDSLTHAAAGRRALEARAARSGAALCPTLADLVGRSRIIFSTVVSTVALSVARDAAPHLGDGHIYMDLNSTSPAVKGEIAGVVTATGARFVEAAVMAAVPPLGHKVPMLLGGEAVADAMAKLAPYGMDLEDFGPEIGRATAAKMFRSIVVKGLEALFLECVMAASRYGVAERVLDYVGVGYPGLDWNKLAHHLIGRTALHGERLRQLGLLGNCAEVFGVVLELAGQVQLLAAEECSDLLAQRGWLAFNAREGEGLHSLSSEPACN